MDELTPGTQIAYIPMHANGDMNHSDVKFGFVTSVRGTTVFCRYWSKHSPGELRTKAGSEGAPYYCFEAYESAPQEQVDAAMDEIARYKFSQSLERHMSSRDGFLRSLGMEGQS